ncbi:MAG: hypothetical protein CMF38_00320 [Legionellaceae bacterium]|nr:hypothetical protein [Legionellaceae bacterium]|tara:strand:- start:359 stop:679 length:321 start_codon:yes stop_codon:yes gene_type:complete
MANPTIYRIIFRNQDEVYEMYARFVAESDMFGFLAVEEFIFGENTTLVIDPSEERLKLEFSRVKRTFIPLHLIERIDEVDKQGIGKIKHLGEKQPKVSLFPLPEKR